MHKIRDTQFYTTHHRITEQLDTIDWLAIGHLTFTKEISHQKANDQRAKLFCCLMNSLAIFAKLKTKRLIYFQNNEVEPTTDYHHIHFLLGRKGLEQFDPHLICTFLLEKAKELKMAADSVITPFDPARDGVGYLTKKVFRSTGTGRTELMELDYHPSRGLVSIWRAKGIV